MLEGVLRAPVRDAREADWLGRAIAGERAALGTFVRQHQDRVYRVLLRLTGDREVALDLTQETFVRAMGALGRFRPGAPMAPWLLTIANRLFIDHVRGQGRERLEDPDSLSAMSRGAEDPAIAGTAARLDLEAALALLPVPWRQAVVLRHMDDLSYDQIAEVLDIPLGTAKTWLFRGRERLRELLGGGS